MYKVDLNSDLGESFGRYTLEWMKRSSRLSLQQISHADSMHPILL